MGVGAGVGIFLDSCESLTRRHELDRNGLYNWQVLSVGRKYLVQGLFARPLGALFTYPTVLLLPGVQIVAAMALFIAPALGMRDRFLVIAVAASLAVLARMLFYMRQQVGLDGSDQMLTIVLLSCAGGAALGNTIAGLAAASYAGLQLLLSYWVAGVAKVISPEWRSGRAIVGITGTSDYGQPRIHRVLVDHPVVARWTCWWVIAFECLGPFLILAGRGGAVALLILGLGFHAGVAIVMRLNNFLWAFAAAYPSVFLLTDVIDRTFTFRR
jgi:hypothetical protein